MSRDTGGLLVETHRRSPFSQMKTGLIFPGSLGKTTEDTLARAYEGSTILSCTTSSGYQVGLLFGAGQPSAVQPSPAVPGTCYLVYFYGNGMCLETSCYELAQLRGSGRSLPLSHRDPTRPSHPDRGRWLVPGCRRGHRPRRPQAGGRFDRARCVHEHS